MVGYMLDPVLRRKKGPPVVMTPADPIERRSRSEPVHALSA